jgi:hypothetical protein
VNACVEDINFRAKRGLPGGHLKLPHLWSPQTPPPRQRQDDEVGLRLHARPA